MANRTFDQYDLSILKRVCHLWAVVAMPTATTPTLQKWNYPTLGTGVNARTYSNAPTPASAGSSVGPFNHYSAGADGVAAEDEASASPAAPGSKHSCRNSTIKSSTCRA